jgi:hypothetical protein
MAGQLTPKEALDRAAQDWNDINERLGKEEQLKYYREFNWLSTISMMRTLCDAGAGRRILHRGNYSSSGELKYECRKKIVIFSVFLIPWYVWGWGMLFLLAGLAGVIYGATKGFSFLLGAGMIYFLLTARGLLLLRHWAWFTALCGFSVVLLFSLLGVIKVLFLSGRP